MDKVAELYGDTSTWNSLATRFLQHSNEMAATPIPKIDYSEPKNHQENKGYYGALLQAVAGGVSKTTLDLATTLRWREMILGEMREYSAVVKDVDLDEPDQVKIYNFLSQFNSKIAETAKKRSEVERVALLGDTLFEMAQQNFFKPVTDRMAQLVMNYGASYFKGPILIIRSDEKDHYTSSLKNKFAARLLVSEKIKEAVFVQGMLMTRVGGKYDSERYQGEDSADQIIVEWHGLRKAIKEWKETSK